MIVVKAEKHSLQMILITPLVTFLKHLITSTNMWILKKSKGRLGNSFLGVPVLLLYSVGFKSGVERETPLFYFRHGDKVVVVGSNGGDVKDPAWVKNVVKNPDIRVNIKGQEIAVRAHVASVEEMAIYWPLVTQTFTVWQKFQERSERQFPIVVLEPR